jgi:hypothetical protein
MRPIASPRSPTRSFSACSSSNPAAARRGRKISRVFWPHSGELELFVFVSRVFAPAPGTLSKSVSENNLGSKRTLNRFANRFLDPGGVTDISRGLRSVSDDTPGSKNAKLPHPGGMPDDRDSISEKRRHNNSDAVRALVFESLNQPRSKPPCLSSLRDEERFYRSSIRGCRIRSTPG